MAIVLNDQYGQGVQLIDLSLSFLHSPEIYYTSLQSLCSMSETPMTLPPQSSANVEAIAKAMLPTIKDDPVSKAFYNNILGNIPKKEKVTFYCDVCSLEFSSKSVMETHLSGYKHQKKLKAKELMTTLEKTETGFEKDPVSGVIRCTVCDITVNSPQLLATHVAGNKHKLKKKRKDDQKIEGGGPAKRHCPGLGITGTANGVNTSAAVNLGDSGMNKDTDLGLATTQSSEQQPVEDSLGNVPLDKKSKFKKNRIDLNFEVPECVSKLKDTRNGGEFLCNTCQAHCNSDVQLYQHINSRKHAEKIDFVKRPSFNQAKRGRGNASRGRGIPAPKSFASFSPAGDVGKRGIHRPRGTSSLVRGRSRARGGRTSAWHNFSANAKSNFGSASSSYPSEDQQSYEQPYEIQNPAADFSGQVPEYGYEAAPKPQRGRGNFRQPRAGSSYGRGRASGPHPPLPPPNISQFPSISQSENSGYGESNDYPPLSGASIYERPSSYNYNPAQNEGQFGNDRGTGIANCNGANASAHIEVPECITELKDAGKGGGFLCNTCMAYCNSNMQLTQHINSKKHADKMKLVKLFRNPSDATNRGRGTPASQNSTRASTSLVVAKRGIQRKLPRARGGVNAESTSVVFQKSKTNPKTTFGSFSSSFFTEVQPNYKQTYEMQDPALDFSQYPVANYESTHNPPRGRGNFKQPTEKTPYERARLHSMTPSNASISILKSIIKY